MKTTFDNWIMNPMVEKNAVFTNRDMYKNLYTEKFNKIMLREAGKIDYTLYKGKDNFYIHIKIPSEVVPDFYYDVVIEFYTKDKIIASSNSLKEYNVRFYSNDPSFVFTYLNVFKKNDMFIEELSSKTSREALTKKPKERNPSGIISYVKSLYFAYIFMKSKSLFTKGIYDTHGVKLDKKNLIAKVRHSDIVIRERQERGEELAKNKRLETKRTITQSNSGRNEQIKTKTTAISKTSKVASAVTKSKKTKKK